MKSLKTIIEFVLKHPHYFLFFVFLSFGIYNVDRYGVGWDEDAQIQIGYVSYDYVFLNDTTIKNFPARDYGVVVELPLAMVEHIFQFEHSREKFLARHFLTHLFFLITALFCYKTVFKLYRNKALASMAFLMLVLMPRFYAESFVNTKDIPFMGLFFVCFYYMVSAFETKSNKHYFYLALCIGVMISLRIMGVMLFVLVLAFMIGEMIIGRTYKISLLKMLLLILVVISTTFATWPYLWLDPVNNFTQAFTNMSKFRWSGTVLFEGVNYSAGNLPWYYLPKWFAITVPILFLMLGIGGIMLLILKSIKSPFQNFKDNFHRSQLIFLFCFFVPLVAVVFFHSVLYDGWRHVYFIYAPYVMLSVYAIHWLMQKKITTVVWLVIIGFNIYMIIRMIDLHPCQQVYFNELVSKREKNEIRKTYDMDYWGLAYRQSWEYLLAHDQSKLLYVSFENDPCAFNTNLLREKDKRRIKLVEKNKAEYFFTNFRLHPEDYKELKPVYEVKVDNNVINAIYRLHD